MPPDPLEMVVFYHKIGSCFPPPLMKILYETLLVVHSTLYTQQAVLA